MIVTKIWILLLSNKHKDRDFKMKYIVVKKPDTMLTSYTAYAIGVFKGQSEKKRAKTLASLPSRLRPLLRSAISKHSGDTDSIQLVPLRDEDNLKNSAVLIFGLGHKTDLNYWELRHYLANLTRKVKSEVFHKLQLHLPNRCFQITNAELAILEGIDLSVYEGLWIRLKHRYKADENLEKDNKSLKLQEVQLVGAICSQHKLDSFKNYCRSVHLSRELVATPANIATPNELLEHAKRISNAHNLHLNILTKTDLNEKGMNGIIAASSDIPPPLFVHMQYKPNVITNKKSVAMIGLGITFDPDGLSFGHSHTIEGMKKNMAGAASVLGAAEIIGSTKPDTPVDFIITLAERDRSLRSGDLVMLSNGETVEINGEHIEGHLMLADALIYAQQLNINHILSIATLNNSAIGCIGNYISPVWSNSEYSRNSVLNAANMAGEKTWSLPIVNEHESTLVSPFADYRTPKVEYGAGLTALFLQNFITTQHWSHIDISGTSWSAVVDGFLNSGATGWGVGTLSNWVNICDA